MIKKEKCIHRFLSSALSFIMAVSCSNAVPFKSRALSITYSPSESYMQSEFYSNLINVNLTDNKRQDIANIAYSQLGYHEGDDSSDLSGYSNGNGNYTEYGRWYGLQDAWCAMFICWCAEQARVSRSVIPKQPSASGLTKSNSKGYFGYSFKAFGTYTPKVGDIVYYDTNQDGKTNHVELVYSVSENSITTIGGNTGGGIKVATHTISLSNGGSAGFRIIGYESPNYDVDPDPDPPVADLVTPIISTDKSSYQVGETVYASWTPSNTSKLSHYWLNLIDPDGTWVDDGNLGKNASYSFTPTKTGNYTMRIYTTPVGSIDGEGSLSNEITIKVLPATVKLTASKSSCDVSVDDPRMGEGFIDFTYSSYPNNVTIAFEHTNNQIVNCKWGEWDGNSIRLIYTVRSGIDFGNETLLVTLKDSESGVLLDSLPIKFIMKNNVIKASPSVFSVIDDEIKNIQLEVSSTTGSCQVHIDSSTTNHCKLELDSINNNVVTVKIQGLSVGTDKVRFDLRDQVTEEVLKTTYITVDVNFTKMKVTFDPNGGDVNEKSRTILYGETYKALPNPIREGYRFMGWYDASEKTNVYESYINRHKSDYTLVARWRKEDPSFYPYIKIDQIELTAAQLKAMNYTVPVHMQLECEHGFSAVEYGVKITDGCTVKCNPSSAMDVLVTDKDQIHWMGYASAYDNRFKRGLCTFDVTLPQNAKSGDEFAITYISERPIDKRPHLWLNYESEHGLDYAMYATWQDGYIRIIDEPIPGDLDGSGVADIMDVIKLNKFILGTCTLNSAQVKLADLNYDNITDSTDSLLLLKLILGTS